MDDLNNLGGILEGFVGICNTEILKSYVKVKILIFYKMMKNDAISTYMGKNTAGPGLLTTEYTKDTEFSGYQRKPECVSSSHSGRITRKLVRIKAHRCHRWTQIVLNVNDRIMDR